jgi:hypothetical protein
VAALTWVALGMTSGFANAAPASHQSSGQAAISGNGDGSGNGGTGNGKGNGNGKHEDPGAGTPPSDSTPPAGGTTGGSDHSTGTSGTSGDPSQPQPPSNADHNPGGANNGGDCGSYCSTRDGSPSHNGNGKGKATGKPCAGCVGKADNKNPPGQAADGSDHNAGYECDTNHGVGKTNPAHTGCAQPAIVVPPPEVIGTTETPPVTPITEVLGLQLTRGVSALALTGGDFTGMIDIAVLLLVLGAVMIGLSRRQPASVGPTS